MLKKLFEFSIRKSWIYLFLTLSACNQSPTKPQITPPSSPKQQMYDRIVIFGDSYSDNGNLYRMTDGVYPGDAYFEGRFSNGLVWSEYFSQLLGLNAKDPDQFTDFAFGQAQILNSNKITVTTDNGKDLHYQIPDLKQQISNYLEHPIPGPDKTLFIIFIGANDVLNAADTTPHPKLIKKMIMKQHAQIERLITSGATHILVVNMRNLSLTPYVCVAAENTKAHKSLSPSAYKDRYVKLIQDYNTKLADNLKDYNNIMLFDAYAFDTSIYEKISHGGYSYQFDNKNYTLKYAGNECYLDHKKGSCYVNNDDYQRQSSPVCNDPQDYFYYDAIHPTTYVHKLMAEAVYKQTVSLKK